MIRYFILLAGIFFIVSCKQNKTKQNMDNVLEINIESKNVLNNVKYLDLITDLKYVPLETTSDCLIGHLDKVEISDDGIFALDSRIAKVVYRFSKDGKFINQIGQRGEGPGEYFQPDDMSIDPNTGDIAILDQMKVLIYKPDNTYLRNIKLPDYAYKIGWYDNRFVTFNRGDDELILLDEKEGKHIGAFFQSLPDEKRMVLEYPFQRYENKEFLYFTNLDYTIYRISEENVLPHVRFVFDQRMFTDKDIKSLQSSSIDDFVWIIYYSENPSHIYMIYKYKQVPYMVIYDKLNIKTKLIDLREIQNDVTFMREPPLIMGVDSNGYFVAGFEFSEVSDPNELKKKIDCSTENLDLMSNPILLYFKFKEL